MAYVLTNKTAQTPLGFGALGVAIEPGQSITITRAEVDLIGAHPVIAGWITEGKLGVEEVEDVPPAPLVPPAPEEPPAPPAPEEPPAPPKVPTPTAKK